MTKTTKTEPKLEDLYLDPIKDQRQEDKLRSFQPMIEQKSGYKYGMFEPIACKSVLDGGMKYTIKIKVSESHCIIARIFEPSAYSG